MFTRRAVYHPYKRSAPSTPAGFRIADYLNRQRCFNLFHEPDFTNAGSPDPSPLNSPTRSPRHAQDDPSPAIRFPDLFGGNGFESPQRAFAPRADHPQDARPDGQKPNGVPNQGPSPVPPYRRKGKRGPKHPSSGNGAPRRRGLKSQQAKEKRDTSRRALDRHERRLAHAREGLGRFRREAETLMTPEHMTEEDKIFLKQLEALQLNHVLEYDLEECRQRMSRAAGESTKRKQEHKERDVEAAKMWGEGWDEEAQEQQTKKVEAFMRENAAKREAHYQRMEEKAMALDEEKQRAHELRERVIREAQECLFRRELASKAEEENRRRREEQERRMREERERQIREENERQRQEEWRRILLDQVERLRKQAYERLQRERRAREERERHARAEQERVAREERERRARAEQERVAREERERRTRAEQERVARERERQTQLLAEQARRTAREDQERRYFVLYEGKWNELRTNNSLPPIDVREMPWPVFDVVSSAEQITYEGVRAFLFHSLRPGMEGKTARDKVKSEVLRFHPDKFNARVVPKIQASQQALAQEIAGAVARILTSIMTGEQEE